jgi:uncharacterized protein YeaO (DUF488 family)
MSIQIKRAYEDVSDDDGYRVLVDRLWPRGLSKENAKIDLWLRDIAPSTELRQWYQHDPEKWDEFRKRYDHELDSHPDAVQQLADLVKKQHVTLVYSSKVEDINNAVALKEYLEKHHKS